MEVGFMTADTTLPPCMPLPRAMLRLPISSTAKVMYARMLDIVFLSGIEDTNGILFIHFPIVELAAALARSTMTVKRSLNELEDAGLILRVRQGFGEPNKIYVLIPKKEHQIETLTRKERTHRLCTRAAMLESYLPHPEAITDEQVSLFLKLLFHKDSTRQLMEKVFAGNGNFQGEDAGRKRQ